MNTPSLALTLARNIPELIDFVAGIQAQGGVTNTLNRIAGAGFVPTTGAPSNAAGVNGQYALDVTNSVIYGPKAGGIWPAGVSFKGAVPTFTSGTATSTAPGTPPTITVASTGPNSYSVSIGVPQAAPGAGTGDMLRANNLNDVQDKPQSRTNLGLGTLATQNANNVNITGGTVAPSVDIAVADGGTGASSAPAARSNLGIPAFGTAAGNLTPLDSNGYFPASTINPANVVLSIAGLAGSVTAADLRQAAALRPGIEVQAWDADLDAFAAITTTNIVYVRTANGVKPATLSGITLGGTADAPVLTGSNTSRVDTLASEGVFAAVEAGRYSYQIVYRNTNANTINLYKFGVYPQTSLTLINTFGNSTVYGEVVLQIGEGLYVTSDSRIALNVRRIADA